jgi:hypothetical protein
MTIITCELMGGLGNQLFQISNLLSICEDYKYKAVIPKLNKSPSIFHDRKVYWNNLFTNLPLGKKYKYYKKYKENNSFKKIELSNENTILCGYFQSYRYFDHNKNFIVNKLFTNDIVLNLIRKYDFLKVCNVSIHVRRGDYLKLDNIYKILDLNYYENALTYFPKNIKKIVFSDDIEYCRMFFKNIENIEFIENIEDYEQMILMSMCSNNIIANSTFSWWSAYLNKNGNKKIIVPKKWYLNNKMSIDIPKEWIILNN